MEKIILASASPRRREILDAVGIEYEVVRSDADESSVNPQCGATLYVQELALLKAGCAAKKLAEKGRKNMLIISADTVVVSDGKILGKPKDDEDAFNMLRALSGKTHEVMTGICIFRLKDAFSVCDTSVTRVTFKELSDEDIREYIKTGEPADKAGAYGIQGRGALLCERIEGDYFNVVGLPASRLWELLKTEFNFRKGSC
jgi:septum formation protein